MCSSGNTDAKAAEIARRLNKVMQDLQAIDASDRWEILSRGALTEEGEEEVMSWLRIQLALHKTPSNKDIETAAKAVLVASQDPDDPYEQDELHPHWIVGFLIRFLSATALREEDPEEESE